MFAPPLPSSPPPLSHIVLSAQDWGHGDVAQGYCVSQATQAEW